MPNQKGLKMEDMSIAFLRTICAANGYSVGDINHDNDGVDIVVRCKGKPEEESIAIRCFPIAIFDLYNKRICTM